MDRQSYGNVSCFEIATIRTSAGNHRVILRLVSNTNVLFSSETFLFVFLYKGHRRVASVFHQTSVHRNRWSNSEAQGYPAFVQLNQQSRSQDPFSMVVTTRLSSNHAWKCSTFALSYNLNKICKVTSGFTTLMLKYAAWVCLGDGNSLRLIKM